MERAIVLLSGGIDSAVTLWWAKARGWDLRPLTFDYFGRPKREHGAITALTQQVGVENARHVELPFLKEVDDLRARVTLILEFLGGFDHAGDHRSIRHQRDVGARTQDVRAFQRARFDLGRYVLLGRFKIRRGRHPHIRCPRSGISAGGLRVVPGQREQS